MKILSGVTDQYIYFVAVDATDLKTRETGFSSFTVYRSRDGAAAAPMTTPTINETDSSNMPGVYELLLDEDMTIGAGNDTEEMVFHITHAGMAPVTRVIEIFRGKITTGNTLDVTANGEAGLDFGNTTGTLDAAQFGADFLTAAKIADGAFVAANFASSSLDGKGDWNTVIPPTVAEFEARTIVSADYVIVGDTIARVTLVDTTTALSGKTGFSLAATGLDAIGQAATGVVEIAKAIWDRVLTAATHNISTSAGRRIREIGSNIVLTGTSPDSGGTANTAIRIELDGDASAMDGAYDPAVVVITGGTGVGQSRQIFEYDGTNKYAYVNRAWKMIPDDTSKYTIVGHSGNTHVNEGLVTGGGNTSITLNSLASSIDDTYTGQVIFLYAGTGEDQARTITAYNGTSKIATVDRAWETNPANGLTIYAILPLHDTILQDAEIAKIPKSDSNVTFNVTALASINAECDTAISDAGLPEGIPKNALFNNIEFLMVDETDFATPETGLTVTGQRSINGGAFAGVSGAIAEVGNGIYQFDALAADLNGDVITFKFSSAGAADTFLTIKTSS